MALFLFHFNNFQIGKVSVEELTSNFENIVKNSLKSVDFDVDGVVFEVVNDEIKSHMGSNRKFHRWQIAFQGKQR